MVRERTPARLRTTSNVEDSWVVNSDGDDEYTPEPAMSGSTQDKFIKRARPAAGVAGRSDTKSRKETGSSAEPEFVMPSIHQNGSVCGSWVGEEKQQETRPRRRRPSPPSSPERPARSFTGKSRRGSPTAQDRIEAAFELVSALLLPVLQYARDVVSIVMQHLKIPIALLLLAWILGGICVLSYNFLFSSISSALSPICRIPGVNFLKLHMCHYDIPMKDQDTELPPPVRFGQLMQVQDKFDEILREAAGGVSLPLDMKRGETSIRDLRQLVRFSTLHSRNELVLEFDGFIETARVASYDLGKFNSHVGRSVDNILATARWTKRVLDGIAEQEAGRGAIAAFISDKMLAPFQPVRFNEDVLLDQYQHHTRIVEDEVERLIDEAQALLLLLQNLEDRLDVINGVAIRDDLQARGSKEEVLGQLWTMLGGNRKKLGKYNSQLRLLDQVNAYRQNAIAHVSGTLVKLQAMGAELEELRERIGGVDLLGTRGPVSLRLHIENIERGVERLEKGRKGARELENEELQRNMDRGRTGAVRMIDET